jgi:hypothetical protein
MGALVGMEGMNATRWAADRITGAIRANPPENRRSMYHIDTALQPWLGGSLERCLSSTTESTEHTETELFRVFRVFRGSVFFPFQHSRPRT